MKFVEFMALVLIVSVFLIVGGMENEMIDLFPGMISLILCVGGGAICAEISR